MAPRFSATAVASYQSAICLRLWLPTLHCGFDNFICQQVLNLLWENDPSNASAMPVAGAKPSPFTRCIHARPHYFLENLIELHPRPTQVSNSISAGDARVRVVAVRHFGTAIVRFGSTAVVSGILALGPLHLNDQTLSERVGTSRSCRFCCKSPQLSGDNFLAIRRSDRRAAIFIASVALARSLTSLSSGDEVPYMFTRTSRLWPLELLISSAKRLLQQNLPIPDLSRCNKLSKLTR